MIQLPIFWQGEEISQLKELGIETERDLSQSETKEILFFSIDNITPYMEDGIEYSGIRSGGKEFICKYDYETLKALVIKSFGK